MFLVIFENRFPSYVSLVRLVGFIIYDNRMVSMKFSMEPKRDRLRFGASMSDSVRRTADSYYYVAH